ncbi:Cation efflux system protein CusC precursor [Edwardsiella tarda]|nr:Cation efflux system protein CusC precursor [Edwardsiella tarda]
MSEQERQNFLASQQAQRAVQILVVANVAQAYFTQQLAYAQLRIAEETLQNYRQSYSLIEQQVRAGSNNLLALEQARGQIESTQATLARREGSWHRPTMPSNAWPVCMALCPAIREA